MSESPATPASTAESSVLLILCRDLMLGSRITATAQAAGVPFRVVRDAAKLAGQAGKRLIVDLNQDGAVAAAAGWSRETGKPVVGFVSHVDGETIRLAHDAGIQQILPRSQFVQRLPELV